MRNWSRNKPKLLILADGMPVGGAERQIIELLKGLRSRKDFFVAFGVLVKGGALESEALRYSDFFLPLPQKWQFDMTMAFSVFRMVKKHHIALIHTYGIMSDIAGLFVAKTLHIPYINGSMRSAPPRLNHRDMINRCCMPFADKAVANSHAGLRAFKMDHNRHSQVIYNGVDLNRFKEIEPIIQERPTICMVGNFTKRKDQESLIRSLPFILEEYPQVKLLLIGKKRKKFSICQRLVTSLELKPYVEILTNTNRPEPYILGCNVTTLISNTKIHGEGISNAIIEYMALGKPVVATDCGGNKEIVDHGLTGYLIPTNKPSVIADYILKLLHDSVKAKQMGLWGQKKIIRQFGLERMLDEYTNLYWDLLKKYAIETI